MSNFADRFFWARARTGLGAPAIAEKTGCGQALISNIERGAGAKSSSFNDKFAKLFKVDPNWLRTGEGRAPEGFDPKEAHDLRVNAPRRNKVVHLSDISPRWSHSTPDSQGESSDEERAQTLQRQIFADFQDYARLVGPEQARSFIEILERLAALVPTVKKSEGNGE